MTILSLWALLRRFWPVVAVAVLVAALLATRASLGAARADLRAEKAAHAETAANYRAAAEARKASDIANVQRVSGEATTISAEVTNDYEKRLASLRADFAERVRRATATHSGSAAGADLPVVPAAAGRTDETACDPKLPPREALIASEQAEQLVALQALVRRWAQVNVNGTTQ